MQNKKSFLSIVVIGLLVMNPAVRAKVMRNWKVSKVKRQEELHLITNSGIKLFLRQHIKS
ncbi:MAG: hypothetical protein GY710_02885 [Desulfobacteraceae bacterium]|nr:hypothetical protein [Desulfobacteraceae bacterium]